MMKQQGVATAQFGEDLVKELEGPYAVYYDHGDPDESDHVAACKAFYGTTGEGVQNVNRLADVDVLVTELSGRAVF